MMCGGASQVKDVDDNVQEICDLVKAKLLEKCGKDAFDDFKALNYRSQVVAGSNYFVKIRVSPEECIHVRIYEPLPCNNDSNQRVFLHGHQAGKKEADSLDSFDQQYDN